MSEKADYPTRCIIGFHLDEVGDWVADLDCGHTRHVRHDPPWQNRPWVADLQQRKEKIGAQLACKKCMDGESSVDGSGFEQAL